MNVYVDVKQFFLKDIPLNELIRMYRHSNDNSNNTTQSQQQKFDDNNKDSYYFCMFNLHSQVAGLEAATPAYDVRVCQQFLKIESSGQTERGVAVCTVRRSSPTSLV